MNFLKIKTCWSALELGILKMCLVSAGVIIGSVFYKYSGDYLIPLCAVFLISTPVSIYLWIKKLRE